MTALLLSLLLTAAEPPPATWTVKPGDTCTGIAQAVWGDSRRYAELHKWNELGPPPHTLQPGMVLWLRAPVDEPAGPDATLTFLKPSVRARREVAWEPATLGMGLFRLDEVNTLKGAGAALRFRDTSTLLLDENALLVVYGDRKPPRPTEPLGVTLIDGELRVALAQMRARPLAIHTGAGDVSASGLQGVVSVDGAQTARVCVFEGTSQVSAKGKTVVVPQNHGTRVRRGQPPEPPRLLPDAPVLTSALPKVVVAGQGGLGALTLAWGPAARAEQYRVQLARDADFVDRLRDVWTTQQTSAFEGLEPGPLQVRLIAFDEVGLQSRPSAVSALDVVQLGGGLDAQGELLLAPGAPLAFALPPHLGLRVAGALLQPGAKLPVGAHPLQVLGEGGEVLLSSVVVVPPAAPRLLVVGEVVRAYFDDELPDALAPQLHAGAAETPFTRVSARVWEVPRPSPGTVSVFWRGRPLARVEVGADLK